MVVAMSPERALAIRNDLWSTDELADFVQFNEIRVRAVSYIGQDFIWGSSGTFIGIIYHDSRGEGHFYVGHVIIENLPVVLRTNAW